MLSNIISIICIECVELGLSRSQRDFCRSLLGRGPHYLRLVAQRRSFASERTAATLRHRLTQIAERSPECVAIDIERLIERVDHATAMARWLRRR